LRNTCSFPFPIPVREWTNRHWTASSNPFFTTKGRGKGTGLGLATVYGIVKQSGGYIWVYSEPGQGTTFKIYFPKTSEKARIASGTDKIRRSLRGTETVLLVEEQARLRRVVSVMLKSSGYKVLAVESPEKGLQAVREHTDRTSDHGRNSSRNERSRSCRRNSEDAAGDKSVVRLRLHGKRAHPGWTTGPRD